MMLGLLVTVLPIAVSNGDASPRVSSQAMYRKRHVDMKERKYTRRGMIWDGGLADAT